MPMPTRDHPPKLFRELRRWLHSQVKAITRRGNYLEAYRRDTDRRVDKDPHAAVGGMWEVIGPLQFEFLKKHGLRPDHTMLDIGCGTLRGGRHFIGYLDADRYTGFDISPKAIEFAEKLIVDEELGAKRAKLLVTAPGLTFGDFAGQTFDFLLAQSVFTHLPAENVEECFANVGKVMHQTSQFFFTFVEREAALRESWKGFRYPFAHFETLAARYGFAALLLGDYDHPRSQQMVRLTKRRQGP